MARTLVFALSLLLFSSVLNAQDGIYGSALLGQKFVNLDPLNDQLIADSIITADQKFPGHHWTVGGEGHAILAKRWVIGGKGYVFWHNREQDSSAATPARTFLNVLGGVGMGTFGFCLINSHGFHLYPQVGVGVSSFLFQVKQELPDADSTFSSILHDPQGDHMVVLQKIGLVTDASINFDWYIRFIKLFGLGAGPMLHAEAGTTWDPVKLDWMRDIDKVDNGPELRFLNPYINVGIGIGINIQRDN